MLNFWYDSNSGLNNVPSQYVMVVASWHLESALPFLSVFDDLKDTLRRRLMQMILEMLSDNNDVLVCKNVGERDARSTTARPAVKIAGVFSNT